MRYFSMFSGIGGFELGIERATEGEWECIGYSEIDKYAIKTYSKRFPSHHNFGSANEIKPEELPEFELLCGGFPCQAFSVAGRRKGFEDTRGTLFFEIARIVKSKRPHYLLLENVKGLLNHDKGETFRTILRTLDELGYNAEWQVFNSKHFGVPQNRERVFIVGHLRGKSTRKIFPIGENVERDFVERKGKDKQDQISSTLTAGYSKNPGGNNATYIGDFRFDEGLRWRKEKISPTLCSNNREGISNSILVRSPYPRSGNPKQGGTGPLEKSDGTTYCLDTGNMQAVELLGKIRRLTPIECERLQGFPDNWTEGVSDTQRYKQCGNAVTVNVIEAIINKFQEKEND